MISNQFRDLLLKTYESSTIEAIRLYALVYIIKSVSADNQEELISLSRRLSRRLEEEQIEEFNSDYNQVLDTISSSMLKRIAIPTGAGYRYCDSKDIVRVEASRNYSNIHLQHSKKPILVSKNLKQFEKILTRYGFLRVHNAHLINPYHIKEYIRQDGGAIILSDGLRIVIGPSYRQVIINFLNRTFESI